MINQLIWTRDLNFYSYKYLDLPFISIALFLNIFVLNDNKFVTPFKDSFFWLNRVLTEILRWFIGLLTRYYYIDLLFRL